MVEQGAMADAERGGERADRQLAQPVLEDVVHGGGEQLALVRLVPRAAAVGLRRLHEPSGT